MDRLAAHVVATAALTAAFALVPFAMEQSVGAEAGWDRPLPPTGGALNPGAAREVADQIVPGGPMRTAALPAARQSPDAAAATASTAASATGPAASASASATPSASASASAGPVTPCPDAYQVGSTEYASWHGMTTFVVEQYYSPTCRERYGYAQPTAQFLAQNVSWDLGMAVFDVTHDAIDGPVTYTAGQGAEDGVFWSEPVSVAAGSCTEGLAHVFYPDDETDTFTSKVCL